MTALFDSMTKWETQHAGALGASEVGQCIHCVASRMTGLAKTNPFSRQQKSRMKIGKVFEARERALLREEGKSYWVPNKPLVIDDYAVPIMLTPDILVRNGGGEFTEVREVKFRSYPPATLPAAWRYQMGVYQLKYPLPGVWGVYNLEERSEFSQEKPPEDIEPILREWTQALRLVLDGVLAREQLPHEPYFCRRSEWACPDCIGARPESTELSMIEERRLNDYLRLEGQFALLREREKELEAAKEATKEILAAHGNTILRHGLRLTLRESKPRELLDKKLIPPEILKAASYEGKPARSIVIEKEIDAVDQLNNLIGGGADVEHGN